MHLFSLCCCSLKQVKGAQASCLCSFFCLVVVLFLSVSLGVSLLLRRFLCFVVFCHFTVSLPPIVSPYISLSLSLFARTCRCVRSTLAYHAVLPSWLFSFFFSSPLLVFVSKVAAEDIGSQILTVALFCRRPISELCVCILCYPSACAV